MTFDIAKWYAENADEPALFGAGLSTRGAAKLVAAAQEAQREADAVMIEQAIDGVPTAFPLVRKKIAAAIRAAKEK